MLVLMARLTTMLKLEVIRLRKEGFRILQIRKILEEQNNFTISRQNLTRFISRFEKTGLLTFPKKERKPTKVHENIMESIDRCMEENDETSSTDLMKKIFEMYKIKISAQTVKRVCRKLGWLCTGTKYCLLVRERN